MEAVDDYYQALERLIKNTPVRVPKGSKISNDSVALEAGRGRGCIKKSRPQFFDLIEAIRLAAEKQSLISVDEKQSLREVALKYRDLYEAALVREVSLLAELTKLRADLAKANSATLKVIK